MRFAMPHKKATAVAAAVVGAGLQFVLAIGGPASATGPNGIDVTFSADSACQITVSASWAKPKTGQIWLVVSLFDTSTLGSQAKTVHINGASGQVVFTAAPPADPQSVDIFAAQVSLVSDTGSVLLAGSAYPIFFGALGQPACALVGNT